MAATKLGQVVHSSPGRVRVRVARPYRSAAALARIERALAEVPGVTEVETSHVTGSVLVRYDPALLSAERLMAMGHTLGLVGDATADAGGDGAASWASQVDKAKVARSIAILAAAVFGGVAAPAVGLSARVGSIGAALAAAYFSRPARQERPAANSRGWLAQIERLHR